MYNPRFPYSLRVIRAQRDAEGNIEFDENGDALYAAIPLAIVAMAGGDPIRTSEGFVTEESESIPFGYRGNNKNVLRAGDVAVADWHVATPLFATPLVDGDILELTDFERTYRGEVVKKCSSNWGSDIWFNEVKN